MEYNKQQKWNDPKSSKSFINAVRTIVQKELESLKFDKTYTAIVKAVNGNLVNITLMDSEIIIPNVKNKSGETLNVGDQVLVEAINNSLNNIVIKYKK